MSEYKGNYIDAIAIRIHAHDNAGEEIAAHDWPLYRLYAVLVLAKGSETTAKDVHDAWSAWAIEHRPFSKNIIPFDQLTPEVQARDNEYVVAIHAIAAEQDTP